MKAIAAMSLNRVIGRAGKIPWHLPEDFRWFRKVTLGHAVLMGRKTFESLGRPLPSRVNLVVTRGPEIAGVITVRELSEFDPEAVGTEVFVIGGAEVYAQALPRCSDLYLSVVRTVVEGDTFFPEFEPLFEAGRVVLECAEFEVRHYRRKTGGEEPR